jgi:hypothetical protein
MGTFCAILGTAPESCILAASGWEWPCRLMPYAFCSLEWFVSLRFRRGCFNQKKPRACARATLIGEASWQGLSLWGLRPRAYSLDHRRLALPLQGTDGHGCLPSQHFRNLAPRMRFSFKHCISFKHGTCHVIIFLRLNFSRKCYDTCHVFFLNVIFRAGARVCYFLIKASAARSK